MAPRVPTGLRCRGRKSVLVSSHVLAEVAQTVDDVLIINRGKLVLASDLHELMARSGGGVHVIAPEAARLHDLLLEDGYDSRILDTHELLVRGVTTAHVGDLAGAAGVHLHELSTSTSSLEDVFLELTAKEN